MRLATAPDLARVVIVLNARKLVTEETLAAMGTRRKTEDGKETNYGLGWRIGTLDGKNTAGHGGGQAGTSTYLLLLPDRGVAVAVMRNLQGAKMDKLAGKVAKD